MEEDGLAVTERFREKSANWGLLIMKQQPAWTTKRCNEGMSPFFLFPTVSAHFDLDQGRQKLSPKRKKRKKFTFEEPERPFKGLRRHTGWLLIQKKFSHCKFNKKFCHNKILVWIRILIGCRFSNSLDLDPAKCLDLDSMNTDPKHCWKAISVEGLATGWFGAEVQGLRLGGQSSSLNEMK